MKKDKALHRINKICNKEKKNWPRFFGHVGMFIFCGAVWYVIIWLFGCLIELAIK